MNKLQEFWYCVAPQNDIPLYRGEALDDSVVTGLLSFLNYYRNNRQETFLESIQKALLHNPHFINDIRLLLGISDKRFYLDMTYLAHISTTANGERLVAEKREDLLSKLNVVAAKTGQVFDQDHIDPLGLGVLNEPLDPRTVKIRTRVPIINIGVDFIPAPLSHIVLKQQLLILDTDGFPVAFIIIAQTAVDTDVVCFFNHLCFPSRRSRFHTSCGVMAPQGVSPVRLS